MTVVHQGCPACGSDSVAECLTIPKVPVYCNVLWSRRSQALAAPKGELRLTFCENCGHLFNRAFDQALIDYTVEYENSLHFSSRFNEYAEDLVGRLGRRYGLHGKTIVEVGCGKGEFLHMLCSDGSNRGYGFDLSYAGDRGERSDNITFIKDYYSDKYAKYQADFLCCRHVLEHVTEPLEFIVSLTRNPGVTRDTVVYFEVPNVGFTLEGLGIWDLIYEHVSYFSAPSFTSLFERAGFTIHDVGESFGGQYLYLEGQPTDREFLGVEVHRPAVQDLADHASVFRTRYEEKIREWRNTIREGQGKGDVVVWGAGSKGVTFVNVLEAMDEVKCLVDLNPHKQGKYVPGTGQRVVAPERLRDGNDFRIIVMNPIYEDEIRAILGQIGVRGDVLCA